MGDPSDWRIETAGGLALVRCLPLAGVSGVVHGFSTRADAHGADLDVGPAGPPSAPVAEARRRFCAAVGLDAEGPVILRQVHGDVVLRAPDGEPEADGVFALDADRPRLAPAVRTADCVPLLLADAAGRAVAAVHSGWRGTVRGVARRAVEALRDAGIPPDRLIAALGPAIGVCCYEVEDGIAARVAEASGVEAGAIARPHEPGHVLLDLRRAVALQLRDAGVREGAIHRAPWCSRCRRDLFHSYRRDGTGAGRMLACVGWRRAGAA